MENNENEEKAFKLIDLEDKYVEMFTSDKDKEDPFTSMGIGLFPRIWYDLDDDKKIDLLTEAVNNNKKLNELDEIIKLESIYSRQMLYTNIHSSNKK